MSVAENCRYTNEHEWARLEGNTVIVGITDYAQEELGDVVFIEIPEVGAEVKKGESFSTIESVKAVSDIYAPVDGTVTKVNQELADKPELINEAAFEAGWIIEIEPTDSGQLEELMDPAGYQNFIAEIAK